MSDLSDTTKKFKEKVIDRLKDTFTGKDEVLDLIAVAITAGENIFLYGPPGTAKSAIINSMSKMIDCKVFDYLLTKFTEPNEIFGPFDISKLREGELVTNTEGMLPEASIVFLDELLNANSAILNSLLNVLNERVFRRGREFREIPLLLTVGASNHLPEDNALKALFDRFLLRVNCTNVPEEELNEVLRKGWNLEKEKAAITPQISIEEIKLLQNAVLNVSLDKIQEDYINLIQRHRHAGLEISDRRAVKIQKLIAASALLSNRQEANISDMWVLKFTWDAIEQQEIIKAIVDEKIRYSQEEDNHPRSSLEEQVNAEALALEIEKISTKFDEEPTIIEVNYLRDRISAITARVEWIKNEVQRDDLKEKVNNLWNKVESFNV